MSKIEDVVCTKILSRAEFGLKKYGVTLERDDLTELQWLIHAQEEAMDLANYLEVLIQRKQAVIEFIEKATIDNIEKTQYNNYFKQWSYDEIIKRNRKYF